MFENLTELIKNNKGLTLLQTSNEFYFQKGQEAINNWLSMVVPEEQKTILLELSGNYERFIQIGTTYHPELILIKDLLYTIISYCDEKARNKNRFNEYENKRTLARAGVRMGPWIKGIIEYKFNKANVTGSTKNAFDFLIDPVNNSTILSENHRSFIIQHYLSKPYQQELFVSDLKQIFKTYNLSCSNESNYTHLLSSIVYNYDSEWKPRKRTTFKELIEELKKYKLENNLGFNLIPFKANAKYIWLTDSLDIIGNSIAHYEVGNRGIKGNKDTIYIDVHFESKSKSTQDVFFNTIAELPEDLEWFDWYESKSVGYKEKFQLSNEDNLAEKIFNALEYIDETIGETIRSIIKSIPNTEEKLVKHNLNNFKIMESPLNQILFGPPGTGKTFNTINEALQIVDPTYYGNNKGDRKKLTDRFKELLIKSEDDKNGQIGFCTFHQSFSYEDFVEGIKPKTTDDKNVYYVIESGVFKRICQLADSSNSIVKVKNEGKISWTKEAFKKASFYKISLGEAKNINDKEIYDYCRDNSYIAIGFGQENDFSGLSESEITEKCKELKLETIAANQMYTFIHYLKKGNYVMISNGNKYVRALGKVTGDYEYWEESPIKYNHFRKVEWVFVDENIPIEEIYERGLSQKTMYKIDETALKMDFFTNNGQETLENINTQEKKYVLIIDEINRGNVSSIFGELITLIEKDKRAGCDEELELILPYSKEPFKVPKNVYIIGTMNTADRSVEALDTALRRRFSFKEMMPNEKVIAEKNFKDYDRTSIMNLINQRIEVLLDRNYTLGHSYFIKEDFKNSFQNEIIPLLQEYFYNDYGKIGLVLGKGFVREKAITAKNDKSIFADFDTKYEVDIVKSYELIPFSEIYFEEAIQTLLV